MCWSADEPQADLRAKESAGDIYDMRAQVSDSLVACRTAYSVSRGSFLSFLASLAEVIPSMTLQQCNTVFKLNGIEFR